MKKSNIILQTLQLRKNAAHSFGRRYNALHPVTSVWFDASAKSIFSQRWRYDR